MSNAPALNIPRPGPKPVAAAPRTNRMTLDRVTRGRQQKPHRVVLYGVEGIGKSTFAATAPEPIFLGAEDGTAHLDVARLPAPESWGDVFDAIETLITADHSFQTFAVDSLDWIEPMVWADLCRRNDMKSIEDFGYGKGYVAALDEWRRFLSAIERLQNARKMHVVLIAHSVVKPFKNPEGPDFDRYQMKLHDKAAGLVKEWAEDVLFANYQTFANKDERTKRVKGVSTGARLVYTVRTAAYDAKNRHNLPEEMPLGWEDFVSACATTGVANDEMRRQITEKAKGLDEAVQASVAGSIGRIGEDAEKLAQLNAWVNTKLGLAQ